MPNVQTTGFQPLSAILHGSGHGQDRALQRTLRDGIADALGLNAKGQGIEGLAIAIRDRLAAADAGGDSVPFIMKSIEHALDDAAAKLAAQGLSPEEIDAGIARFRSALAREIGELAGAMTGKQAATGAAVARSLAEREDIRERFSLNVLTAEGDHVAIRFRTVSITEVAAATTSNDGDSVTTVAANVISRGRLQVEVDGDLDEAERAAIGALLDKVDAIASDFFGGDVQAAFAAAARVGLDSDALSAFELKLSYARNLAAVKTYASNAAFADAPAAKPANAQSKPLASAPAEPVKLPAETQVTSSTAASPEGQAAARDLDAAPASEGTATSAAVAHNTARAVSAIETITQFAKDVLERLDEDDESQATKFSLRWKVEFMIKAFGSVALTPIEQKAAAALGIALDGELPA